MLVKINEASKQVINWLVAKIEGVEFTDEGAPFAHEVMHFNYTGDWSQGGAISEREGIASRKRSDGTWYSMVSTDLGDEPAAAWSVYTFKDVPRTASTSRRQLFSGETRLHAEMRAFCASRLGEKVEIADSLMEQLERAEVSTYPGM